MSGYLKHKYNRRSAYGKLILDWAELQDIVDKEQQLTPAQADEYDMLVYSIKSVWKQIFPQINIRNTKITTCVLQIEASGGGVLNAQKVYNQILKENKVPEEDIQETKPAPILPKAPNEPKEPIEKSPQKETKPAGPLRSGSASIPARAPAPTAKVEDENKGAQIITDTKAYQDIFIRREAIKARQAQPTEIKKDTKEELEKKPAPAQSQLPEKRRGETREITQQQVAAGTVEDFLKRELISVAQTLGIRVRTIDTKAEIFAKIVDKRTSLNLQPIQRRKNVSLKPEEDQLIDLLQMLETLHAQHLYFKDYVKAEEVERRMSVARNKLDAITRGEAPPEQEKQKQVKQQGIYRQDMAGALTSLSRDSALREMGGAAVPTGDDWKGNQADLMVPAETRREAPQSRPTSIVSQGSKTSIPRKPLLQPNWDDDEFGVNIDQAAKALKQARLKQEADKQALKKAKDIEGLSQKHLEEATKKLEEAQKGSGGKTIQERASIIERTKVIIDRRKISVEKSQRVVEEAQQNLNASTESVREQAEILNALEESVRADESDFQLLGTFNQAIQSMYTQQPRQSLQRVYESPPQSPQQLSQQPVFAQERVPIRVQLVQPTTSQISLRNQPSANEVDYLAKIQKLEKKLKKQEDDITKLYEDIDSKEKELAKLQKEEERESKKVFGENEKLKKQINKLDAEVQALKTEVSAKQSTINDIQKKLTQEEIFAGKYQMQFLEERQLSERLQKEIASKQKELETANESIQRKNTEIVQMEERLRLAEPENTPVFKAMKQSFDQKMREYNADVVKYAKLLAEKESLAANFDAFKSVKTSEVAQLKETINKLQAELQAERETLDASVRNQANMSIQTIQLVQNELVANQQNTVEVTRAVELLQQIENENPQQFLPTDPPRPIAQPRFVTLVNRAKLYITNTMERLHVSSQDLSIESVNISGALNESRSSLDRSRSELTSRYESFLNLSNQSPNPLDASGIIDSATDVVNSVAEVSAVAARITSLEQERDEALRRINELYGDKQTLLTKTDELQESLEIQRSTTDALNLKNLEYQEDLENIQLQLKQEQEKVKLIETEKGTLDSQVSSLRNKLQSLRQTTPAMQNTTEIDRVTGELRIAQERIETFEAQNQQAENTITLLQEQKRQLETQYRQSLTNERDLNQRIATLEEEAINTETARQEERRAFGRVAQTSSDELNRARDLVADLRRQLAAALEEVARLEGRQPNVRVEREIVYQDRFIDRPVDRIVYRNPPGAQPADNFPGDNMQRGNLFTNSNQFAPLPRRTDRRRPTGAAPVAASQGLIELLESLNVYINSFFQPRGPDAGGLANNTDQIQGTLRNMDWDGMQNALRTQGMRSLNDITSQPDSLNQLMTSTDIEIARNIIRRMKGDGALPLKWRPGEDQEEETILLKNVIQLPEQVKRKKSQDKFTYGTIVPAKGIYQIKRQGLKYIAVGEGKKATFNTERDAQYFISAGGWGRKVYGPRIAQVFGVRPKNLSQAVY